MRVEIADRNDARLIELPDSRKVVPARDAAHADRAYIDPIAGSVLAKDAGGNDGREADGSDTPYFQEIPARRWHRFLLPGLRC
jgi:hypothetical protein